MKPSVYTFGPFRMDAAQGLLSTERGEIALTPKAFETLLLLVQNAGAVVSKDDLIHRLWPDSYVDENNLAQNISLVRKALATADPGQEYVRTVPRRGYRFTMSVDGGGAAAHSGGGAIVEAREPAHPKPQTRYARSGEVNIAYQVLGEGPIDLVFVMGWVSHLEMFWEEPSFAAFLRRLARFSRLILFDKRGTGLSDSVPLSQLPTLEQRMDDVRAVMHAAGSRRAVLMGVSEGGTMASLFAATWPEHTAGVVIIGGYARRLWAADYPWGPTPEQRESFIAQLEREWGGPVGIEERAPSRARDPVFREWWAAYLRMGASPGAAAALTRMNADIDIRPVLPSIRVPTLVIHRSDDRCLLVQEGRYMADRIPGARFLELPGDDHLPFVGDQDAILDAVEEFVGELHEGPAATRVLATLLFLRPLADPGLAGDELEEDLAREVSWFHGRRIGETMYGLVAAFDGPARAIRCAGAVLDEASAAGIRLGAALHTGECELVGDALRGLAVEVGGRIAETAGAGEIVVTRTVRDLVAGSGLEFDPRDQFAFGNDLGEWPLFTVRR